ncbi:MAG: GTPase, partial [Deltaproteobacteria bacterium]
TEVSLQAARGRLDGVFSSKVKEIKEALLRLLVHLEAELDFSEDEVEGLAVEALLEGLVNAGGRIERLLATYEEGRAIKDGVRVLILGRPNVGKSSLLNILLEQERAIVTPHPGTTRDVIEEAINLRGVPIRLMDTAGLRDTDDHAESIGVRLARERIETAELILFVIDASSVSFNEDMEILKSMEGKKVIVAANKTDLAPGRLEAKEAFSGHTVKFISALDSTGMEELKDAVYEEAIGHPYGAFSEASPGDLVATIRQRDSLVKALDGVKGARAALEQGLAREFIATDLRYSVDRLGEITGETTTEDILDRIFSGFCIGK